MTSRYASLTRDELATLVPELLLIGQLIDRSGMAWCISAFGREEMAQIAIEEWAGSSPFYTRRMQRALGYEGTDVVTIFKGLQLDIGAPPQFMDFRYAVTDPWHGEFWLDHCGALMDVEPMGEDYVRSMCHDIEDPTFDATAVATNAKAQVRPIHRPPRASTDQHPHCRWTVVIDEAHEPVTPLPPYYEVEPKRAVTVALDPIVPGGGGLDDYAGPLVDDLDFAAVSHAALVRIAGKPMGLMANNPRHLGGAIDAEAAEKGARFMDLCETYGLPILSLCDTPGFMVGPPAEETALVRRVSRMFLSGAALTVPLMTVVLRKGYGLGAQAMAAGSFQAPVFIVSWPTGEFGGMGLEGAVRLAYRNELAAIADPAEREATYRRHVDALYEKGKATSMAAFLEIDAIIDPAETRHWILRALASAAPAARPEGKRRPFVPAR